MATERTERDFGEWSRVDPRTVMPVVLPIVGVLSFFAIRSVVSARGDLDRVLDLFVEDWAGIVPLVMVAGAQLVRYVTGRFRIADGSIQWRSGLLFRHATDMSLERVQDVATSRPVTARLLGLSQVTVSSAGADGEIHLRYLAASQAEDFTAAVLSAVGSLRDHHLATTTVAPPVFDPQHVLDARTCDPTQPPRRTLHRVDIEELCWSAWNTLWPAGPLTIVFVVVGVLGNRWQIALIPAVASMFGLWGLVSQVAGRFNLSVDIDATAVRTSSGLTTVKKASCQLQRIQVVYATSTWMQRRRGTERIDYASADATVNAEELMREHTVAFDVKAGTWRDIAPALFGRPVLGARGSEPTLRGRAAAATTLTIWRWSVVAVIVAGALVALGVAARQWQTPQNWRGPSVDVGKELLWAAPIAAAFVVAYGMYRARRLASVHRWAIDDHDLLVRSNLMHRRTLVMPRIKTQAVRITQGPLQRRLGLATVRVNLAPLDGTLSPRVRDITLDDAVLLADALADSATLPLPAGV